MKRLEARISELEAEFNGQSNPGQSHRQVVETQQKSDALEAQMQKRLAGVKKGMAGLHERLQSMELTLAKLPEQFKGLKAQNKETEREQATCTGQIEVLREALPGHSRNVAECQQRANELCTLAESLLVE